MPWQKGQSGNPGGRPAMHPDVREAIQSNGELAVRRMRQLLDDDTAWGQGGWMKPREQVLLASLGQERAFGKPMDVMVGHVHEGAIEFRPHAPNVPRPSLREIADRLPERRAQKVIVEAQAAEPE